MLFVVKIGKKVDVPEDDIQEVIRVVNQWFVQNPDKGVCRPAIFGHAIWDVNRASVEADVRAAAAKAHPYTKA